MTIFWIITASMLLAALAGLAWPLLRKPAGVGIDRNQQNIAIARERLSALEADNKAAEISDEEYQQVKTEVEKTLADELQSEGAEQKSSATAGALGVAAIGVLLPVLTLGLYFAIGSPQLINGATAQQSADSGHDGAGQQSVEQMVQSLAERLKQEPENAEGWFLLGRSLMSMGKYGDAAKAFEVVDKLQPDNPPVMLALANAVAMAQNGKIGGRPEQLVNRALELDPTSTTALWLAGIAAEERGDYKLALVHWGKAEPTLKPADQQELRARMQAAATKAGVKLEFAQPQVQPAPLPRIASQPQPQAQPQPQPQSQAPGTAAIKVRVSLDPALAGKLSPEDTVFVFAKAVNGPPMP
ncbi:MAG: c-type cytochrome biogenesis protein CcmI, partial [Pseudomonadota bacterium]|nr:c-type cytochrome biogenesis protein CcmI [Pseudomonadota bacterium]